MCKISVGAVLTAEVIENLTEHAEKGAGIVAVKGKKVVYEVNVKGDLVREMMKKDLVGKTGFFLYHSRLPSAGTVSTANTQPFFDPETGTGFGHNGTLDMMSLLPLAIATKTVVNVDWSDSKVLWETLRKVSASMREMVLATLPGNFVWIDLKRGKVELYGTWRRQYGVARTTYKEDRMIWNLDIPLTKEVLEAVPRHKDSTPAFSYRGSGFSSSPSSGSSWDVHKDAIAKGRPDAEFFGNSSFFDGHGGSLIDSKPSKGGHDDDSDNSDR